MGMLSPASRKQRARANRKDPRVRLGPLVRGWPVEFRKETEQPMTAGAENEQKIHERIER